MSVTSICCLGADHIGVPVCSLIASKWPEVRIVVLDNPNLIAEWNSDVLPIHDPELNELIKKCRNRNLYFRSDFADTIRESKLIFISYKAPIKTKGLGQGKAVDLKPIEDAAKLIATYAELNTIVVEKSTMPCRVVDRISMILQNSGQHGVRFDVLSNPELPKEGSMIQSLLHPEKVLIGCAKTPNGRAAAQSLSCIYERWVPLKNIMILNANSAELSKLVVNAFLAQKQCSINYLIRVCEKTGADVDQVLKVMSKDPIVKMGYPREFPGDVRSLVWMCESLKLPKIVDYWEAVLSANDFEKKEFLSKIQLHPGQTVAVWGISSDEEKKFENPTPVEICKWLLSKQAAIKIYDPKLQENQILKLLDLNDMDQTCESVVVCNNPYSACEGASAVISITHGNLNSQNDFEKVFSCLEDPKVIVDGPKLLNGEALENIGFHYLHF